MVLLEALLGSANFHQLAVAYLVRYFRGLLTQNPVVMLLEDLHWAGESTLHMLHYLVRHLAGQPLLLVGTYRPEAVARAHPLRGWLRWARPLPWLARLSWELSLGKRAAKRRNRFDKPR